MHSSAHPDDVTALQSTRTHAQPSMCLLLSQPCSALAHTHNSAQPDDVTALQWTRTHSQLSDVTALQWTCTHAQLSGP